MSTIPEQIMDKFIAELFDNEDVSDGQVAALKELLSKSTKPKAPEIEAVFAISGDEQL